MTIKHSEKLDQLFSAMSKLQGKLENAKKDNAGFNNNYKYAKLEQYIELSKELLAEHGLCVFQFPGSLEIVEVTKEIYDKKAQTYFFQDIKIPKQQLTTQIGHESGQFISETMEILVEKMVANSWGQCTGVAVSFERRYALAGGLGMTQEDDDNQLSKKDVEKSYYQQKYIPKVAYENINQNQVDELTSLLIDDLPRLDRILEWAQVSVLEDLSTFHYEKVMEKLKKEGKVPEATYNKNTNLIAEHQASYITRLVDPERLNKILKDYNLNKLEDMTVEQYNLEYDNLRQETTTTHNVEKIKAVN